MSGKLGPITVEVTFKGESYLAEITPTINGKPVALRPEMHQAEAAQRIYTKQLQAMLSKQELTAGYKPAYGFLTEATSNGFAFEKGSMDHAALATEILWKEFVDSLHTPEPFLRADPKATATPSSELGSGLQVSFGNNSAYMKLSADDKKAVHVSTLFKALKEFKGEAFDNYTDPEMQYVQYVVHKHGISLTEKERLIGRLYHNLITPEKDAEIFSTEEINPVNAEWLRIRGKALPVANPVVIDNSAI